MEDEELYCAGHGVGQDEVVQGGFGLYPGPKPRKIASSVAKLIVDDKRLQSMGEKALATARAEATQEIARDIGNIRYLEGFFEGSMKQMKK